MKKILLSLMMLVFTTALFAQTFEDYIGKKLQVEYICRGKISDGKAVPDGDKHRLKSKEFLFIKNSRTLIWFRHDRVNKYDIAIDRKGDIKVIETIQGKTFDFIQILADKDGRVKLWSDDSFIRYAKVESYDDDDFERKYGDIENSNDDYDDRYDDDDYTSDDDDDDDFDFFNF